MLFWLLGGLLALLLLYWLVVLAEGAYFGPAAVRLLYQRGAGIYDGVREKVVAGDEAVLFLEPRGDRYLLTGMVQGRFKVERSSDGTKIFAW